jgi:UDP-2-acetamido-2,6-beta-L-arabino-hexul-4-ose reductase
LNRATIVVTGSDGFVGKNLCARLGELGNTNVVALSRAMSAKDRESALISADFVFHTAGVNRPQNIDEFSSGNADLTASLCRTLLDAGRSTSIVHTSSIQASLDNPYGRSKAAAEKAVEEYGRKSGADVRNLRLHNVFGKWSRPGYNSAVATFCHNISRGLPIRIDDHDAPVSLVYIDDVVTAMVTFLESPASGDAAMRALPLYNTTVGVLAAKIRSYKDSRRTLIMDRVGTDFDRALYATYVSFLPTEEFSYTVPKYDDPRGTFVEMLKTQDTGQFSYFTAHPGVTRGGHYHHSKTEKFLVIRGTARFRFRHLVTNQRFELQTSGQSPRIVETVPGWSHDITNVGEDEMFVMLWANEIFDRNHPDTYKSAV